MSDGAQQAFDAATTNGKNFSICGLVFCDILIMGLATIFGLYWLKNPDQLHEGLGGVVNEHYCWA